MAEGKRDGRREARWRRAVGEQARSGLTIREFCRRSKLTETGFYFWRRELERRDLQRREAEPEQREGPSPQAAFVPVRVAAEGPAEAGCIEILLSGGHRVHVTGPVDREALADVLAVLAGERGERNGLEGGRC